MHYYSKRTSDLLVDFKKNNVQKSLSALWLKLQQLDHLTYLYLSPHTLTHTLCIVTKTTFFQWIILPSKISQCVREGHGFGSP